MNKEAFEPAEVEVILLTKEDVITDSDEVEL